MNRNAKIKKLKQKKIDLRELIDQLEIDRTKHELQLLALQGRVAEIKAEVQGINDWITQLQKNSFPA